MNEEETKILSSPETAEEVPKEPIPKHSEPTLSEDILKLFKKQGSIFMEAKPLEPLWGFLLFKKAISMVVGDAGAGKTTWGYGLSYALCRNRPFLGIPANETVNTLYFDFESSDALIKSRQSFLGEDEESLKNVTNFTIFNSTDQSLKELRPYIIHICKEENINLIVIDNQSTAFNTRDENDNAEAIQQIKFIRSIINETNTACILFHHPSKANVGGIRKGTGAFARIRLCDIGVNIDSYEVGTRKILKMEVVKNRFVNEETIVYLEKIEGQFKVLNSDDIPIGIEGGLPTDLKIYDNQKALLNSMSLNEEYKLEELQRNTGISYDVTRHSVQRLLQLGLIRRSKYAHYMRVKLS